MKSVDIARALSMTTEPAIKDSDQELAELKQLVSKYERALDIETWNTKLGKFMKWRDMPDVAKVLQDDQPT